MELDIFLLSYCEVTVSVSTVLHQCLPTTSSEEVEIYCTSRHVLHLNLFALWLFVYRFCFGVCDVLWTTACVFTVGLRSDPVGADDSGSDAVRGHRPLRDVGLSKGRLQNSATNQLSGWTVGWFNEHTHTHTGCGTHTHTHKISMACKFVEFVLWFA